MAPPALEPYLALMAAVIALLIAVAIGLALPTSGSRRCSWRPRSSSSRCCAASPAGLMALARRLPRSRITMLRLAIANIYRPGAR